MSKSDQVPLHGKKWRQNREKALERDNNQCKFCGITDEEHTQEGRDERGLDVHHIVPRQDGGTHDLWNLMTVCRSCHALLEECTRKAVDSGDGSVEEVVETELPDGAWPLGMRFEVEDFLFDEADSVYHELKNLYQQMPTLQSEFGEISMEEYRISVGGDMTDGSKGQLRLMYLIGLAQGISWSAHTVQKEMEPAWFPDEGREWR